MNRVRSARYPDGLPYVQVDLPPLTHDQLYILDCLVDAIWNVLGHKITPSPQLDPTVTQSEHTPANIRAP